MINTASNTYHGTIKMKPVDIKPSTYIGSSKEINNKDPKSEIGNIVGISKHKNIFCKSLCSKLVWKSFCDKKAKNTVPWTYVISDIKGEETIGTFYEKELQNTNQKEFRIEK